jgi:hypothetical protein
MWKNCVQRGRMQMVIRRMRIVCLIPKAINRVYVIYSIAFPLQQWLQKHVSVLSYAYIACPNTRYDVIPNNVPKVRHV